MSGTEMVVAAVDIVEQEELADDTVEMEWVSG